jgi:hypothetical protein
VVSFCMVPYLSLFLHETLGKSDFVDPVVFSQFSQDAEQICARARHSLKLFEDTHRGITGQMKYLKDDIVAPHSSYFIGSSWLRPAHYFGNDLGIFRYGGKVVGSTHAAAFHVGVESSRLFGKRAGPELAAVMEQYGRCFGALGARLDTGAGTFVLSLEPGELGGKRDVRSKSYYARAFNGEATSLINGLLTDFQGMINFVDAVLPGRADVLNLEYTVFKVRYIALYQVLVSLGLLYKDATSYGITSHSMNMIRHIIESPEVKEITSPSVKQFRNTLMHYNLLPRADRARVDLAAPIFGLVPIYFPSHDFHSFSALVDACTRETATTLNAWATI